MKLSLKSCSVRLLCVQIRLVVTLRKTKKTLPYLESIKLGFIHHASFSYLLFIFLFFFFLYFLIGLERDIQDEGIQREPLDVVYSRSSNHPQCRRFSNKFDSNNNAPNKLLNFLEFQLKIQFYEFPDVLLSSFLRYLRNGLRTHGRI